MRIPFAIGIILHFLHGFSQEPAFLAITRQQGLPSNTVYDLFQDSKGFLWVATENGLARFNGADFRSFTNPVVRSLAVSGILEDPKHRIWVHNFFGEILFVDTDSLQRLESWESLYRDGFPTISQANNLFWISSSKQLFEYNDRTNQWKNLDSATLSDKMYSHHFTTTNGELWVCYNNATGIVVTNQAGREFIFAAEQYGMQTNMQTLFEWNGQVFLFDRQQQKIYNIQNRQDETPRFTDAFTQGNVRSLKNLGDSVLAFMRSDGLALLNRNGTFNHLLKNKNISSVTTDAEGGLWVGTLNEGLLYFPVLNALLYARADGYLYRKLHFEPTLQQLFAGGFDGRVDIFSNDGKFVRRITTPGHKEVQSLWVDASRNRLLVFTDKLHVLNLSSGKLEQSIGIPAVKKIVTVNDQYAMATSGGLILLNSETFKKTTLFELQRISTLTCDTARNELWVGSQKGVFCVNLATLEIEPWQPEGSLPVGLSTAQYTYPYVVLGSQNNGVYLVRDRKVEKHLTTKNGLPSMHGTALIVAPETLWIGTDKGIVQWNIKNENLQHLNETKGLASAEVYDMALVNQQLWVAHTNGLQRFRNLTGINNQVPRLYLQRAWSAERNYANAATGITLPPDTRQLSFQFDVANNLKSQGNTRIFYRIRELEGDRWNETRLQMPVANYLALPSGKFSFEAYAMNEDGVVSETIRAPLTIIAPFWKQPWFIILTSLITISAVSAIVYYRFRQLTLRNRQRLIQEKREQDLRIAQLTSLRAQMNPHFIFNTLASIQGKVLNGLYQKALQSIEGFSVLLRKVLDLSSRELILLSDEIDVLEKYLAIEQDRFAGTLQYRIEVEEALRHEVIRIPSLLTQPFVENALRHGLMHKQGEKNLFIRFLLKNNSLVIEIEDNGIGRKASAEINKSREQGHRSFALDAYRKRIDLINASRKHKIDLHIQDKLNEFGLPAGTTVVLTIPLGYEFN